MTLLRGRGCSVSSSLYSGAELGTRDNSSDILTLFSGQRIVPLSHYQLWRRSFILTPSGAYFLILACYRRSNTLLRCRKQIVACAQLCSWQLQSNMFSCSMADLKPAAFMPSQAHSLNELLVFLYKIPWTACVVSQNKFTLYQWALCLISLHILVPISCWLHIPAPVSLKLLIIESKSYNASYHSPNEL